MNFQLRKEPMDLGTHYMNIENLHNPEFCQNNSFKKYEDCFFFFLNICH